MCGIVGLISKNGFLPNKVGETLFKQLLYVDALRGWDSTGMFRVTWNKQDIDVYKKAQTPQLFLWNMSKDKGHWFSGKILIGHNRAATRGDVTDDTSHPFQEKQITLVHNGTLWGHRHLADTTVDSHAICHALTDKSPQEFINAASGAYALAWWNNDERTLNLLRNEERPLSLVETKEFFILSSEKLLAEWIATRNGLEIVESTDIAPYEHYRFIETNKGFDLEIEKLEKKKEETKKITDWTTKNPNEAKQEEALWKVLKSYGINRSTRLNAIIESVSTPEHPGRWFETIARLQKDENIRIKFYTPRQMGIDQVVNLELTSVLSDGKEAYCFGYDPKPINIPTLEKKSSNIMMLPRSLH